MNKSNSKRIFAACSAALAFAISSYTVQAADEVPFVDNMNPPAALAGETWCLVRKPAVYRTVTEQVQTAPAATYSEVVPAKFETREEQIMVSPASQRFTCTPCKFKTETFQQLVRDERTVTEIIPAQFEWFEEKVLVKAESDELVAFEASYKTVSEQIMVAPASKYWVKSDGGHSGHGELGICFTMCEHPAKFVTVNKTIIDKEAYTEKRHSDAVYKIAKVSKKVKDEQLVKRTIPAEYATLERQVMESAPVAVNVVIPAVFETIQKQVVVQPETLQKQEIPAKFESMSRQVLDQPETLVWRKMAYRHNDICAQYKEVPGTTEADLLKIAAKRSQK